MGTGGGKPPGENVGKAWPAKHSEGGVRSVENCKGRKQEIIFLITLCIEQSVQDENLVSTLEDKTHENTKSNGTTTKHSSPSPSHPNPDKKYTERTKIFYTKRVTYILS